MNHQAQPGYRVQFFAPLHCHWGIFAKTTGNDGEHQVISVGKFGDNAGKIHKKNFSDEKKQYDYYKIFPVENAWEVCQRAMSHIGKDWTYNLISDNCEHFVTQIETGCKQSSQVCGAVIGAIGGGVFMMDKQKNLLGVLIGAAAGAAAGVMVVNNAAQLGRTQMTHQPRI